MISNITRFKSDLEKLIELGHKIEISLLVSCYGKKQLKEQFANKEDVIKEIDNALDFETNYQSWYSESLALIKVIFPDRINDFKEHYEPPRGRKELLVSTYRVHDALQGLRVTRGYDQTVVVDPKAAVPHFKQQLSILIAAERRFQSSLFDIKQIVQADLLDSEIDSASELLKKGFVRAAGAICGVVIEKHLKTVAENHSIKITKKSPSISDLSQALKDADIIDTPQWRSISFLADIRNLCDHHKDKDPSKEQVSDLVEGTSKLVKNLF